MQNIHAIILGIVEGVTEFLPISSTGHMILVCTLLSIPNNEFLKSFEIIIQLGAIAAVGVIYFRTLLTKRFLWIPLLCAFLPTVITGLVFYRFVKQYLLGNPYVVVVALALGGAVFLFIETLFKKRQLLKTPLETVSIRQAFGIGIGQSLSLIPGVSRAAATMFAGMVVGLSRPASVEFSFLLAIPTMIAATVLDLIQSPISFTSSSALLLLLGLLTSFFTALFAVQIFLRYIKNHSFVPFGVYRIVLAGIYFIFVLL